MPNNPRGGGVSRRIEGEDRARAARKRSTSSNVPEGMSLIARTAGIGRNAEELQWDLNYLLQLWSAIEERRQGAARAPFLIYQESSAGHPRDPRLLPADIGEILIDTDDDLRRRRSSSCSR